MKRFFILFFGIAACFSCAHADTITLEYTKISNGTIVASQSIICPNDCQFAPTTSSVGSLTMNNPRDYKLKIEERNPRGVQTVKAHLQPNRTISVLDRDNNEHRITLSNSI